MIKIAFLLLVPFVGTSVTGIVHPSVKQLHWLSGCWALNGAEEGSGEQWTSPAGGAMLGMARTIRGGRMFSFEYLRIVETVDDTLKLVATPSGQAPAEFSLLTLSESEVVFENPNHDFPQSIMYRLLDQGHLLGRIDGKSDGEEVHVDFPMTRITCEGE